jgi:hypothetical protein
MDAPYEWIGRVIPPLGVRLVEARPHGLHSLGTGRIDLALEDDTEPVTGPRILAAEKREDRLDERGPAIWRNGPLRAGAASRRSS